jgi:hypothetical protein
MKKSALIAIIISLFFISISFASEPVPPATTEEAVAEEAVETISPPATVADLEKVRASIKQETDWLSVRQGTSRELFSEAIEKSRKDVATRINTVAENITAVTQRAVNEAVDAAKDAGLSADNAATVAGNAKKAAENAETASKNAVNAINGNFAEIQKIGTSVKKASSYIVIWVSIIFAILMGLLSWLIIRKQRETQVDIIRELRNGEIAKNIREVKSVVKPEEFTLKLTVSGQEYEYEVPVNERGRYVSLYASKVEPDNEPAQPEDTVRATYLEIPALISSCKSAIKKYDKPKCSKAQKNLIDHLIAVDELKKISNV